MSGTAEVDPTPGLGLRMPDFFKACLQDNKVPFLTALAIGTIALVITLSLTSIQQRKLDSRPICLMRSYYSAILVFPVVWAISAYISLFCPRAYALSELAQGQSEAYAIYTFLIILYMLLSVEACKSEIDQHGALPMSNMGNTIVHALAEQGPKPHFAVPPFGCCFIKCCPVFNLAPRQLLWVSRFVKQYIYLQLFFSVFGLWTELSLPEERAKKATLIVKIILKLSALLAVYGLFVMYKATHDLLEKWSTTRKFVSIKFVIFLSVLQQRVLGWLVQSFRRIDNTCLIDPAAPEDLEHVVAFWSQFLMLLETILMVYLLSKAFPADEVMDYRLHHLELVELELQQMKKHQRMEDSEEEVSDSCSD
eukprot:gb/GFBE01017389.1/.p1 GENE.gb/GFBE01017389.1/~~gb/GFBE01017389.1/.p1  ORF type:complete len:365 (+),score=62.94 gb/GFBE01017389.1/:1-1095(+)